MDKLRMQSSNGVEDNIMKIAQLFPDCVTETVDERSGQPKHLIDFEKLKQNLSDSVMSERAERYQFTWPDKSKAILLANSPINATLRPCREDSVDFDNTQNLYIEGDNLDVLKCLKETYLHKVKMIYIDPPYNTGNDFVYEDDQWKIWHMQYVNDIDCICGQSWGKPQKPYPDLPEFAPLKDFKYPDYTKKVNLREYYTPTRPLTRTPEIPQPYDTFADTFTYAV